MSDNFMYQCIEERIKDISIPDTGTLRDVLKAIDKGALGIALLIDSQKNCFKGIVTDGDIRRALLKGHGMEASVSEISRPQSISAKINTPMNEIAELLSNQIRVIPLLDDTNNVADLAIFDKRLHLPVTEPSFGEKELQYVNECILTGWVSSAGKFVNKFEEIFADFCGVKYAISTSNGTTALHLSLLANNIGLGDEVIVPSLTFIATANAVTYTGAKPVFVDSEEETWNIDPNLIEKAITSKTKAIIPVHLYGHPANMGPILNIAKANNLIVIEDAAEAHGAKYEDHLVGSMGELGVFSFYGNKIVTTGEGGMVVTNDAKIAEKIRILRDHGMDKNRRYWHPVLGFNYRLTNIQAALGVAQMEKIDQILTRKISLAHFYSKMLKGVPGVTLPNKATWAKNVFWLYSILIDEDKFGNSRDDLIKRLGENEISTRPFFPPLHLQPIYATGQNLPIAEMLSRKGISLPSSINLTQDNLERVVTTIIDICR
jgi:perosamine synthetase